MKVIVSSMMSVAVLAGCGVSEPESVSEASQEIGYGNNIFYDKFDFDPSGPIAGNAGWTLPAGNVTSCIVVPGAGTDKNLDCSYNGATNGQGAMSTFDRPANRNYHFQFDVWMSGVTETVHGKVFLEHGSGDGGGVIFQIASGCTGGEVAEISATFEYNGPTASLLAAKGCNGHYRVACIWHDAGNQLRCGASVLPYDPVESAFQLINTPEPLGPFNLVRVLGGIGYRNGTTTFDKVQILSD